LRDLLSLKPLEPIKAIRDFNWRLFKTAITRDGSLIVVRGSGGPGGKVHTLAAFDGVSGAQLWSTERPHKYYRWSMQLDPTGKLLSFMPEGPDGETRCELLEARTGKTVGSLPKDPNFLMGDNEGKALRYSGVSGDSPANGLQLWRGNNQAQLIVLGLDVVVTYWAVTFDDSGSHILWGNVDGTVIDCDLAELYERLLAEKLAW
jgi:hypothetical protein